VNPATAAWCSLLHALGLVTSPLHPSFALPLFVHRQRAERASHIRRRTNSSGSHADAAAAQRPALPRSYYLSSNPHVRPHIRKPALSPRRLPRPAARRPPLCSSTDRHRQLPRLLLVKLAAGASQTTPPIPQQATSTSPARPLAHAPTWSSSSATQPAPRSDSPLAPLPCGARSSPWPAPTPRHPEQPCRPLCASQDRQTATSSSATRASRPHWYVLCACLRARATPAELLHLPR